MLPLYVGIDTSKEQLDVAVHDGQTLQSLGTFPNDPTGFTQLGEQLTKHAAGRPIHLVIEPTGSYHLGMVAYAHDQDWNVSLPNPQVVREWSRGQGQRAKTDQIDARLLASYGAKEEPRAQHPLPPEVEDLDELLHRQDDLQKMLTQERNRLHSLQRRPHATTPVTQSLETVIEALEKALKEVEAAIQAHLQAFPHLAQQRRHLLKVPGIGEKSVLPILVFLYRWDAHSAGQGDAKGLTAFAGLDPVVHTSGTSVAKRPSISKMGDADIRSRLFLCALGGNRAKDTPLTRFYRRLLARMKPKMVALIASARKILVWAFAVFRSGLPFDPALALSKSR
jgi:transposase